MVRIVILRDLQIRLEAVELPQRWQYGPEARSEASFAARPSPNRP